MYKILILLMTAFVINCGGPKKESPTKSISSTTSTFEATVKTIEPMTVISIEKKGPYTQVGKAIGELMSWVITKKIQPIGATFGIYYDDPMKIIPESTRYEVCMRVSSEIKGDKIIKVKEIPATEVVSTIYMGPYDKVNTVYTKLAKWIEENNYMISGPVREIYFNNPATVPVESLKTEIQFQINKKTQ